MFLTSDQPDNPEIVDWSKSVSQQGELYDIPEEFAFPDGLDPNVYKYIAIKFYSSYINAVFYSKYPFYAEDRDRHYVLRYANGQSTWCSQKNSKGFASNTYKYMINGIYYTGNYDAFNTKAGVVNYPLLAVDTAGNIL